MTAAGGFVGVLLLGIVSFANGWLGTDKWVAQRVVDLANTYLVPDMAFDDFSYSAPYSIEFEGVTLTAPDGTRVVAVDRLAITLASAPLPMRPLEIQTIEIDQPSVYLLRDTDAESFALKGLLPFVEPTATDPESKENKALSDIFKLNALTIADASAEYDDGSGVPMTVSGLAAALTIDPQPDEEGSVWHALETKAGGTAAALSIDARVNLDDLILDIASFTFDVDLSKRDGSSALPSTLQAMLQSANARGTLSLSADGTIYARAFEQSTLSALLSLESVSADLQAIHLPIDSGHTRAELVQGIVQLRDTEILALGGRIAVDDAIVELSDPDRPARLSWETTDLSLQDLVRTTKDAEGQDEKIDLAGTLTTSGVIYTQLGPDLANTIAAATRNASGDGHVDIVEGKLMVIPVLSQVLRAADLVGTVTGERGFDDELETQIAFSEHGISLNDIRIKVPVARFRGEGLIGWDSTLDLRLRGGAVERVPLIGEALGAVSGQLVQYQVKGTTAEPDVRIRPLGFQDRSDPEEAAEERAEEDLGQDETQNGETQDSETQKAEAERDENQGKDMPNDGSSDGS